MNAITLRDALASVRTLKARATTSRDDATEVLHGLTPRERHPGDERLP